MTLEGAIARLFAFRPKIQDVTFLIPEEIGEERTRDPGLESPAGRQRRETYGSQGSEDERDKEKAGLLLWRRKS